MACDCIDTMDGKIAGRNTRLVATFCTMPGESLDWYMTVTLESEKIETRKRDKVRVLPTFCPFCGVRYLPDDTPLPTPAEEARS